MKKNTSLIVGIMAIIGTICTAVILIMVFKDRIKECPICKKYFGEDDDLDLDFDFEDLEKAEEEAPEVVAEPAIEEEAVVIPKARRGYIPLKFETTDAE